MTEFDIHKYKKNQYLAEAGLGSTNSQMLSNAILDAVVKIDDSMSYTDFAEAVASILIDQYGTHNFSPFMEVLHARLGMGESVNEEIDIHGSEIGKEFSNKFDVNAHSSMWDNNNKGQIDIHIRTDIPKTEFEEMIDFVEGKGYTVDRNQSTEWFDEDPGERYYYPRIQFSK
tara:strand:+ start:1442 stop:1957 length:516 start_codon:yes stop_codon:yes gene_type:complete